MKRIFFISFFALIAETTTAQDERLVGQWVLKKAENIDGSTKTIDDKMKGAKYVISSNGSLYIDFPSLYKKLPGYTPAKGNWSTNDSKLTTTNIFGTGVTTFEYQIKSDTLILITKADRTYWVKIKKRKK